MSLLNSPHMMHVDDENTDLGINRVLYDDQMSNPKRQRILDTPESKTKEFLEKNGFSQAKAFVSDERDRYYKIGEKKYIELYLAMPNEMTVPNDPRKEYYERIYFEFPQDDETIDTLWINNGQYIEKSHYEIPFSQAVQLLQGYAQYVKKISSVYYILGGSDSFCADKVQTFPEGLTHQRLLLVLEQRFESYREDAERRETERRAREQRKAEFNAKTQEEQEAIEAERRERIKARNEQKRRQRMALIEGENSSQ